MLPAQRNIAGSDRHTRTFASEEIKQVALLRLQHATVTLLTISTLLAPFGEEIVPSLFCDFFTDYHAALSRLQRSGADCPVVCSTIFFLPLELHLAEYPSLGIGKLRK